MLCRALYVTMMSKENSRVRTSFTQCRQNGGRCGDVYEGVLSVPGDDMVEAGDAQLLYQEPLGLHDFRDGHKAVGDKNVDLVQHRRPGHHLQQHWRHPVYLLPIVQAHACTHRKQRLDSATQGSAPTPEQQTLQISCMHGQSVDVTDLLCRLKLKLNLHDALVSCRLQLSL